MAVFTMLFLSHILGDYYLQPMCLAVRKSRSIGYVVIHAAIYAAVLGLSMLLLGGGYAWAVLVCAVTHAVIDIVKQIILNTSAKRGVLTVRGDRTAFVVDQILHLLIMLATSAVVTSELTVTEPGFSAWVEEAFGIDLYVMLSYAALALAVIKPANVFIKKLLEPVKPDDADNAAGPPVDCSTLRAGGYIGALERLLAAVLLSLGQYAAIALVFTAKSIARFRALDNKTFAEYYIMGTLLSVTTAIGIFGSIKLFGVM